jgi:general stress protein YciG
MEPKKQGFAKMFDKGRHKEIARQGGLKLSANREHMAEIGRKGGIKSGEARAKKREQQNDQPNDLPTN